MAFTAIPNAYNPNKLGAGLNALAQGSVPNKPSTPTPSQLSLGSQPQPRTGGAVPMGLMNTPQAATPPTSSQQSYMQNLSQQVTAQPVAAQHTAPQTATPQSQGSYPGQLSTAQIAAEAQTRIDKQRAGLMNAVTGAKTGAKNTYDYTQGLQKDDRVLEDAQLRENLNPFSGGTDYKTAMLSRDRQIADTASSKDYNNVIAGYDAQVASFDTLAPEQQQTMINDLTKIERQYGLDLGALTGKINGQNTMQQNQNNFNNGIALGNLTGQYGDQQTLAAKQLTMQQQNQTFNQNLDTAKYGLDVKKQHIDLANKLTELFGVKVNPTADPMQSYAQVAGLSTTATQKIAQDAKQSTFDNAVKLALANNTITQTQANIMHQAQQIGISQQNADTSAANSGNTASNNQQSQLMAIWKATGKAPAGIPHVAEGTDYATAADGKLSTAEGYASYTDGVAKYTTNQKTGTKDLNNPVDVETSILQSNLPESEMKKLYTRYGLKWGG